MKDEIYNNVVIDNRSYIIKRKMLRIIKSKFYSKLSIITELLAYVICFWTIYMAIMNLNLIPCKVGYFPLKSRAFMGLGFPFLFSIKKKDIRNVLITICILSAIYLRQWLTLGCIGITFIAMSRGNKWLTISLIILSIIFFIYGKPLERLNLRMNGYISGLQNLKLSGDRDFSIKNYIPSESNHSDLIQGFKAIGLWMIPLLVVVLLPVFYKQISYVLSAYFCLWFQAIVDFPFRRWNTCILGIIIILLMYHNLLNNEKTDSIGG